MDRFEAEAFKQKVEEALGVVKRLLEVTRNPQIASEVEHVFADKYVLAENLTNTGVAGILAAFDFVGLDQEGSLRGVLFVLFEWCAVLVNLRSCMRKSRLFRVRCARNVHLCVLCAVHT
jgi:hypothetical protein